MPYFVIKGVGENTNKKRTKRYKAKDEENARTLAEKDGTKVESVIFEKPAPATEQQKRYAKDLGLSFPPDINVNEMSDLISKKVEDDKDSLLWLQEYALNYFPEENGLSITKYIGIEHLIGFLLSKFIEKENFIELIKLLIYSIINNETKSNWSIPFNNLANYSDVQSIAEILVNDKQLINSIKRYNSRDFISFGQHTDKEGYMTYGGSKRTNAYQVTKKILIEKKILSHSSYSRLSETSPNKISPANNIKLTNKKSIASNGKGCLSSIILSIIIIISIFVWVKP